MRFTHANRLPLVLLSCSLLALAIVPGIAQSQGVSIEELEQRLQKAKEDKARHDAAAAKPAAPANTGRLVVEVDAACELRVNGKRVRAFNAADTAVITMSSPIPRDRTPHRPA